MRRMPLMPAHVEDETSIVAGTDKCRNEYLNCIPGESGGEPLSPLSDSSAVNPLNAACHWQSETI